MQNALRQLQVLHGVFIVTWFLFILVIRFAEPQATVGNVPSFLPIALGFVCISEVGVALFLRARFITSAESVLGSDPENQAALAMWRTGNLLSFCFAESITLFGLMLKLLGFEWKIAGVFFAAGLLLLLLWAPRKIEIMPPGVR